MKPTVSVVMASFNKADFIEIAIRSILDQVPAPLELIVVDNHSTDSSPALLRRLAGELGFTLIEHAENLGPSAARNSGIRAAQGDLIGFLDDDDYWLPGKLAKQLKALAEQPQAALCYGDSYIERGGERLAFTHNQYVTPHNGHMLPFLLKRNCINLCSVLVRAEYAKLLFDEGMWQAEDYDLWLRVAQANDYFIYLDEPLVVYRRTGSSLTMRRLDAIQTGLRLIERLGAQFPSKAAQDNLLSQRMALMDEYVRVAVQLDDPRGRAMLLEMRRVGSLSKRLLLVHAAMRVSWKTGRAAYRRLFRKAGADETAQQYNVMTS